MSSSVVVKWNIDIRHRAILLKHTTQLLLSTNTELW